MIGVALQLSQFMLVLFPPSIDVYYMHFVYVQTRNIDMETCLKMYAAIRPHAMQHISNKSDGILNSTSKGSSYQHQKCISK